MALTHHYGAVKWQQLRYQVVKTQQFRLPMNIKQTGTASHANACYLIGGIESSSTPKKCCHETQSHHTVLKPQWIMTWRCSSSSISHFIWGSRHWLDNDIGFESLVWGGVSAFSRQTAQHPGMLSYKVSLKFLILGPPVRKKAGWTGWFWAKSNTSGPLVKSAWLLEWIHVGARER